MERTGRLLVAALLSVPTTAFAAQGDPMGSVGVFVTNTSIEQPPFDEDGMGFGVKGWVGFGAPFASFEYQSVSVGDSPNEVDEDQFRVGGGAAFPVSEPVLLLGKAEFIKVGLDSSGGSEDVDGFGLHGGAIFMPGPAMHLWGTLGWLMLSGDDPGSGGLGDVDGFELDLGAGFNFTPQFGAFIEYRTFMGSLDAASGANDELNLSDLRVGGAFSWGMPAK